MRFINSKQHCIHLIGCLALAALPAASAQPGDPVHWNVVAECRMIVLPQKNALRLLPLLNDSTKIEAAYLELQDLIKSGDAELAAELVAKTVDGAKGVSKSVEEVRYPTEFDPPQLPVNVAKEKQLETFKAWPVVGVTPTQFETREVGATLEFTASVLGDGQWLSVTANPRHARFQRWTKFEAGVLPTGATIGVEQPVFLTFGNETSAMLHPGQLILLGVHRMPEPPASFELFLLRVSAKKVE